MRKLIRSLLVVGIASAGMFAAAQPVVADPSFGSDAAFPVVGVAPNTILGPAAGAPLFGPLLPPPAAVYPSLLTPPLPPGGGEVDDTSFGNEIVMGGPPSMIEFSVGPGAFGPSTGHPGAPIPPPPLIDVRGEAGVFPPPPAGDGAVNSDIFATWPIPIPGPLGCAPLGAFFNVQVLDEDGAGPLPFVPRLGINMPAGSNVDSYDRSDDTVVNPVPGVPLEAPVFFTIDGPTAFGWPAGPIPAPGFALAIPGPGDILAWNPAIGGPVIWATAPALGLVPGLGGDDVDALAVSYISGIPLPPLGPGWDVAPGGDAIMFSLTPGSASLAPTSGGVGATPLPGCAPGLIPGAGTAADLWMVAAPVLPGGAMLYINAEALGLSTVRSGAPGDDNIDAIDFCNTMMASDIDADLIDDGCDFDKDGDGIGNDIDPDDDGDGFGDPQQTLHLGPSNTALAFDNCPMVPNPAQTNTDGNFIDNLPPYGVDDKTWIDSDALGDACDADDDNDGITDADEGIGSSCAGTATSALLQDSDGDRALDRAECVLGFNPTSALSKPTLAACGVAGDADGDKISDRVEFCYYDSNPLSVDSDGDIALDGAKDGCEVASYNPDRVVNIADAGILASGILGGVLWYQPNIDINKDGGLNIADSGLLAGYRSPPGQCP